MARYRVGRSWGVTVVREQPGQPDQLVAAAQRPEDAQLIVDALNLMGETFGEPEPATPSTSEEPT